MQRYIAMMLQVVLLGLCFYHITNFNFFLVCMACLTLLTIVMLLTDVSYGTTLDDIIQSSLIEAYDDDCDEIIIEGFRGC